MGKGNLKIEFHEFRWYELVHTEKLQIYLCKGSQITKLTIYKFIYCTQSILDLSMKWYCIDLYNFIWYIDCLCVLQVMPGLLLCFVLRYDAYKKAQTNSVEAGVPPPPTYVHKVTYFHCSLIGYFLGKVHVLS